MKYQVTCTLLGATPAGKGPWKQYENISDADLEGVDVKRLLEHGLIKRQMVEFDDGDRAVEEETWTEPIKEEPKFAPSPLAAAGVVAAPPEEAVADPAVSGKSKK